MSSMPKSYKPAPAYKDHLTPWRPEFSVLIPSNPVHYTELQQVMKFPGEAAKELRREAGQEVKAILYTTLAITKAMNAASSKDKRDYGRFPDGL